MKHRWTAALCGLAASALMALPASSQGTPQVVQHATSVGAQQQAPPATNKGASLGQNFPNPFNPETRIPFAVGDYPACSEPGKMHRVTLRIYNLLAQVVAIPVLQGGSGGVPGGARLENVQLTCNQYTAYWDGKYINTSKEVASGIYLYRLEVDGQSVVRKMIVTK